MVLVNSLMHAFMQYQHPCMLLTTYVDNYELQSLDVSTTDAAFATLQKFCDLLTGDTISSTKARVM